MKHTLLLNDTPYNVWLDRRDGKYLLLCDHGEGAIEDVSGAVVVADGDDVFIHLHGVPYSLRYQSPVERYSEGSVGGRDYVARAPMPGSVISIAVQQGERVAAGKTLLVIESMKLETAIKAPRDGIVEHIHFKLGQTFERDSVLATLRAIEA